MSSRTISLGRLPEVRFGDVVQVQAIRTNTPNDLDVLLFNSAGFEDYRAEVVNGESTSPEELLAVRIVWFG